MAKSIHWFRQDLRLSDNPAFTAAVSTGEIFPVFILDDDDAGEYVPGAASRWWLHYSLIHLDESLGGKLNIYKGNAAAVIERLVEKHAIDSVCWNHCYEPWRAHRDEEIAERLEKRGVSVCVTNGSLLWDPAEVLKGDGTPYKVFTPFYKRGCLGAAPPRKPLPAPTKINAFKDPGSLTVDELGLMPKIHWYESFEPHWNVGEAGAKKALKEFVDSGLDGYKEGRNFPAKRNVSRLSPHLHFGEISPNEAWHAAKRKTAGEDVGHFCSELAWREFSYNLLHHFPDLPTENLNRKFDAFPWEDHRQHLRAWQQGRTGVPIVDAGMRELWQTGYMHNRVRMIVASFLVKNLLIHWHHGEAWFWDTLVDADLANNSASWQWVAGCGADAAPYFRIFNPVTQGEKFDPQGEYTRHYVPELANLPDKYLFNPWEAPDSVLKDAGIVLGKTYPKPIVDLKESREHALAAYNEIKN